MAQEHDGILQQCDTYITDEFALNPEPAANDEEDSGDDAKPISDGLQFISAIKCLQPQSICSLKTIRYKKIDKETAQIGVQQGKTFELALDYSPACLLFRLWQKKTEECRFIVDNIWVHRFM